MRPLRVPRHPFGRDVRTAIFDGMFSVRYFVSAFMPRKIPHSMPSDPFELVRRWFDTSTPATWTGCCALHEDATNDSGADVSRGVTP